MTIKDNEINVAFTSDNNFTQHLSVAATSLLENVSEKYIVNVYILDAGISSDNKIKIEKSLERYKNRLNLIFILVDGNEYSNFKETSLLPRATYYRISLPELCPDLSRILYLDSDIVVRGDISEIYFKDFGESYLFAVKDPDKHTEKNNINLGINPINGYFNAGVLLLNLHKLRSSDFKENVFSFLRKWDSKHTSADQVPLNAALWNHWRKLDLNWNYIVDLQTQWDYWYMTYTRNELKNAKSNPQILHFAGPFVKPWKFESLNVYKEQYYKYLQLTEYKNYKPKISIRGILTKVIYIFLFVYMPRGAFASDNFRFFLKKTRKLLLN